MIKESCNRHGIEDEKDSPKVINVTLLSKHKYIKHLSSQAKPHEYTS